MKIYDLNDCMPIWLGYQGENKARSIHLDVHSLQEEYPDANIAALVQRPGESTYYPINAQISDGILEWEITAADTAFPGLGMIQIQAIGEDGIVAKSCVIATRIERSMDGAEIAPPDPFTPWINAVLEAGADARQAASDAKESSASAGGSADQAAASAQQAAENAESIAQSAQAAQASAGAAAQSAADSNAAKIAAQGSAATTLQAEANARGYAENAQAAAGEAAQAAENAQSSAQEAIDAEQRIYAETTPQRYEIVVDTPLWRNQPTIVGGGEFDPEIQAVDLNALMYGDGTAYANNCFVYLISKKDANGVQLPDGQFMLMKSGGNDEKKRINQIFYLENYETGNAGKIYDLQIDNNATYIDFVQMDDGLKFRDAGMPTIDMKKITYMKRTKVVVRGNSVCGPKSEQGDGCPTLFAASADIYGTLISYGQQIGYWGGTERYPYGYISSILKSYEAKQAGIMKNGRMLVDFCAEEISIDEKACIIREMYLISNGGRSVTSPEMVDVILENRAIDKPFYPALSFYTYRQNARWGNGSKIIIEVFDK